MKKLIVSFLLLIVLIPSMVFAGGESKPDNRPSAVSTEICDYEVFHNNGKVSTVKIYKYICYKEENGEKVEDDEGNCKNTGWTIKAYFAEDGKKFTKGPDSFEKVFSAAGWFSSQVGAYMSQSATNGIRKSLKDYKCPKKVYVDITNHNEICFDDGGGYCKGRSNAGTAFQDGNHKGSAVVSGKDKYVDQMREDQKINVDGDLIIQGSAAVQENSEKNIDHTNSTYNDGYVPQGYQQYADEVFDDRVSKPTQQYVNQVSEETKKEIEQKCKNGVYTEAQCTEYLGNIANVQQNIKDIMEQVRLNKLAVTVTVTEQSCETLLGNPDQEGTPAFYMVIAFTVMKYVAIIILIVVTVMDFIGAASSQDADALKKVTGTAITRLLLCVVIFLLPTLIEFILKYIAETKEGLCGIK